MLVGHSPTSSRSRTVFPLKDSMWLLFVSPAMWVCRTWYSTNETLTNRASVKCKSPYWNSNEYGEFETECRVDRYLLLHL